MIQRNECLSRLAQWREKQNVKIISGIRGCGKTTLLAMYIDWLKRTGVQDGQIVFISMEAPESESLLHYQGLYGYIKKRLCAEKYTYVFIDEAQLCAGYQKAMDALVVGKNIDLYAAVSNGCPCSDPAYTEIRMLPMSFNEHLIFSEVWKRSPHVHDADDSAPGIKTRIPRQKAQMEKFLQQEAFNEYLALGGFPFAAAMNGDTNLARNCIEGIYHTVLVKETARQPGINDICLLEQIIGLLSAAAGHSTSSKKICALLKAKGAKISPNTVEMYMRALTATFVFYHCERYDIKTGKRLKTLGKYYMSDPGMRNVLPETAMPEIESQLENMVFLELLRRGFSVYAGKHGRDEVNFIAFENNGESQQPSYYQVVMRSMGQENWMADQESEPCAWETENEICAAKLAILRQIPGEAPKYILSLDEPRLRIDHTGIIRQNLIDWLISKEQLTIS